MTTPIFLLGMFTKSKLGQAGLTVTVDVDAYELATGTHTAVVTAASAVEARNGIYYYRVAAADPATYDYTATFKTSDTSVDQQHVAAWRGSFEHVMAALVAAYLDAAVSSRLASASYTAAPAASANASAVRAELATELARMDAAISSRLAAAGYTAAPDATAIQAAVAAALAAYDAATATAVAAVPDALLDDEEVSAGLSVRAALAAAGSASDPLRNPASGYVAPQIGFYMQRLANDQVQVVSVFDPVTMALRYRYGDDYENGDGRAQSFTTTHDLSEAGTTVTLRVQAAGVVVEVACEIVDASTYLLEVGADDLASIGVGTWRYDLEMLLGGARTVTEIAGEFTVERDVR